MGCVALLSMVRCARDDAEVFVCSEMGADLTLGALFLAGPAVGVGGVVAMLLVRRRRFVWGLLLVLWWTADGWTGGWVTAPLLP